MEHNIVIPFDFSNYSTQVFQSVNDLVKRIKANIHLLHVIPGDSGEDKIVKAKELLEKIPEKTKVNGNIYLSVLKGEIAEKVLSYASGLVNPVIFISHTSGNFSTPNYTGPNAESIIANSPYPVFLLKKGLDFVKINTILLVVDIEQENRIKLNHAVFLSRFFNNALIRLLHVDYDLETRKVKKLTGRLEHLRSFFLRKNIGCYGEIVSASSKDRDSKSKVAVEYAEQSGAELMLIATNDEKAITNFRISDHAYYIISNFRNNIFSITPFVSGAGKLVEK